MTSQHQIQSRGGSLKVSLQSPAYWPHIRRSTLLKGIEVNADAEPTTASEISNLKQKTLSLLKRRIQGVESEPSRPQKKRRRTRGFASPDVYKHLHVLQDHLREGLDVMFCGINPGCTSAEVGHHYANPTNHFWKCLHQSGLTEKLLSPAEDHTLPASYNLGLTNLVDRPSAEQAELSKQDMLDGVPSLLRKITKYRPRVVCFLGKGIWLTFAKAITQNSKRGDSPFTTSRFFTSPPATPTRASTPVGVKASGSKYFSGPTTPAPRVPPRSDPDVLPQFDPESSGGESDETCRPKSLRPPAPFASRTSSGDHTSGSQEQHLLEADALSRLASRSVGTKIPTCKGNMIQPVFEWGMQPCKIVHTECNQEIGESLFYVMPSTSARVVSHQLPDKVKLFVTFCERLADIKAGIVDTADMVVLSGTPH